jgi:hypothetical protein
MIFRPVIGTATRKRYAFAFGSVVALWLSGCATTGRTPGSATESPLALQRVVLYRNGVGYFERSGTIEGRTLRLRVRKDQVNDLLKSLVVVDRNGRVLGVSLPLDPQSWHKAALAALTPGHSKLASVLDSLRGTEIDVVADGRRIVGRIVMVERMEPVGDEPDGIPILPRPRSVPAEPFEDHKLTLLDGDTLHVVRLSQVENLILRDGDIAMQLHRHLDASAGEGMFQQVELEVRLDGDDKHDLALSYVVESPLWKPTYRLVLDDKQPGRALLQAWAVVDNTSGESWRDVHLSLTSGAPLAFKYDLHTPREGVRPDLSHSAVHKQASVALGERTLADEGATAPLAPSEAPAPGPAMEEAESQAYDSDGDDDKMLDRMGGSGGARAKAESRRAARPQAGKPGSGMAAPAPAAPPPPVVSFDAMQGNAVADARAARVSGLTRFDLPARVTLPDGSATMVALIQKPVAGEQVFLYKPGGSGSGYELNPYRVVRFQNDTEFVLEPGPISIYAGGSFVGEGLSEAVGSREKAVIPFAVEPSIVVRQQVEHAGQKTEKVKLVRGVLEVEAFEQVKTTWTVQGEGREVQRVLLRHPRYGGGQYQLVDRPKDTEDLPDAYLVPVVLEQGKREATLVLVEQTPSRMSLSLWDGNAVALLDLVLAGNNIDAAERAKLEPIVKARRELGRIDTELGSLEEQRMQVDQRAQETRASLKSIDKDKRAGALRSRLQARLEELVKEGDAIGRKIVDLQSKRLELKIELEELIEKS